MFKIKQEVKNEESDFSNKLTLSEKMNKLKEIKNAKAENEESAMKFFNVNIENIERNLVDELNNLENNIDI